MCTHSLCTHYINCINIKYGTPHGCSVPQGYIDIMYTLYQLSKHQVWHTTWLFCAAWIQILCPYNMACASYITTWVTSDQVAVREWSLTLTVLVTTIDALGHFENRLMTAQCEGMGEVGSARYEPALLPPCPSIRALCSNCQRSTQSHQQSKG